MAAAPRRSVFSSITARNRGVSFGRVIGEVNRFTRGWVAYFRHAACKTHLEELDQWLRHKLRCLRLKQCNRRFATAKLLIDAGVPPKRAWLTALSMLEAAAKALAVDGDQPPAAGDAQGVHPRLHHVLKLQRIEAGKDAVERVVRRNAAWQVEHAGEPVSPNVAELSDIVPAIRPAQDGDDGHDDHLRQRMQTVVSPRIDNEAREAQNGSDC